MKASGMDDVLGFDYMDKPSKDSLMKALEELLVLGALDEKQQLTPLGKKMAEFPIEPAFAKVLLRASEHNCTSEVIDIISLLSVENVFYSPNEKREQAAEAKKKFISVDGDHITLLNVLKAFLEAGKDKKWCQDNFIHARSLNYVLETRKQLRQHCSRLKIPLNDQDQHADATTALNDRILQTFLEGFKTNLALLQADGTYKTLYGSQTVHVHPSSVLFNKKAPIVLYNDLMWTTKRYMRVVSRVQREWLIQQQ